MKRAKRILVSLFVVAGVVSVAALGTRAYFTDTETSNDNVLRAGAIDLKIDSEAHYNGLICAPVVRAEGAEVEEVLMNGEMWPVWHTWQLPEGGETSVPWMVGWPCWLSWEEKDLGVFWSAFFQFWDIKPGDWGENTISFHVYNNDAWGRISLKDVMQWEGGCTEPEREYPDPTCWQPCEGIEDGQLLTADMQLGDEQTEHMMRCGAGLGELQDYLQFEMWLDQGREPGFQNGGPKGEVDPTEGDNVWQEETEPGLPVPETWMGDGSTYYMAEDLAEVYALYCQEADPSGHNQYGYCHGLSEDGHLVGSTTYYIGLRWWLPKETGNIVQTDGVKADLQFDVVQYRNNPNGEFGDEVYDYVDIGDEASESGHDLAGWSDAWVKPGWGGNYGGGSSDESLRLLMGHGDACEGAEEATFVMHAGAGEATQLTLEHLSGQVNDSFDVYVNGGNVGAYTYDGSPAEVWLVSTFTFAPVSGDVEVELIATNPNLSWCAQWGQVAFSNATLQ